MKYLCSIVIFYGFLKGLKPKIFFQVASKENASNFDIIYSRWNTLVEKIG